MRITHQKLIPECIHVRGHNDNPQRKHVAWDLRKPWFDILIDRTSGFDPAAGHWYWTHGLLQIAAESLASTRSGATIIRSTDRFSVATDPHIRPGLDAGATECRMRP